MEQLQVAASLQAGVRPSLADTLAVIDELTPETPRQHPLGFVFWQQVLDSGLTLRLHLWFDATFERTDGLTAIHDHVYDLSSLVVYGTLRNTIFQVGLAPSEQQVVTVDPISLEVRVEADGGTVAATVVHEDVHPAGSIYAIPRRTFHSSAVISSPALTLVTNSSGSGRPRVLTTGSSDVRSGSRQPSPPQVWQSSLEMVRAQLAHEPVWPTQFP